MKLPLAALAAVVAAASLAACGSDEPSADAVKPETAKASIEQAARVTLAADTVSADARDEGLQAAYSNTPTAAEDKQLVSVFVVKDADVAEEVSAQVRQTTKKPAKLFVDGNVMVVYAAAGDDRSAAVEQAVKSL
jgi:hypothetical protein